MFESTFGKLPITIRKSLEKRLETLVLTIDEDKVPAIKEVILLAQSLRSELSKNHTKD